MTLLKIDTFFERIFWRATDLVCDLLQMELAQFKKALACANVLIGAILLAGEASLPKWRIF